MQNKKVHLGALSIAGYNCRMKYIPGATDTCADLLSRKSDDKVDGKPKPEPENKEVVSDVIDKTYEVNV